MFFIYFFSFPLLLAQKNMDIFKLYPHFGRVNKNIVFSKNALANMLFTCMRNIMYQKKKHAEVM